MKKLLNSGFNALMTMLIVFVIGMLLPMLFTSMLVIFGDVTYQDVLTQPDNSTMIFWIACIIGWLCGMFYINDELKKSIDEDVC